MKSLFLLSLLGCLAFKAHASEVDASAFFTVQNYSKQPEYSSKELYTIVDEVDGRMRRSETGWSVNFVSRESKFSREVEHSNLAKLPEGTVVFRSIENSYSYDSTVWSERDAAMALHPVNMARYTNLKRDANVFSFLTPKKGGEVNYKDVQVEPVTNDILLTREGNNGGLYYYRDDRSPGFVLMSANYRIPEDHLETLFLIAKDEEMSAEKKITEIDNLLNRKYFYVSISRISWEGVKNYNKLTT